MKSIKLVCQNCNQQFFRSQSHIKCNQRRGLKNVFCSRKCHYDYKKRNKNTHCLDCGSSSLYDPGWQNKVVNRCKPCFDKLQKQRHKVKVICIMCGIERTVQHLCTKESRKQYICPECYKPYHKPNIGGNHKSCKIRYNTCTCGALFISRHSKKRVYCQACLKKITCRDCGAILAATKHHKSTGSVCSQCMYERRAKYKLRAKIGNKDHVEKILTAEALQAYGLQLAIGKGGYQWRLGKRRAAMGERIFKSER